MLQDGLDECVRWGEVDIQGLLMLEGAKLEAQRGKMDNSRAMLKVLKSKHTHPTSSFKTRIYIFYLSLKLSQCRWATVIIIWVFLVFYMISAVIKGCKSLNKAFRCH